MAFKLPINTHETTNTTGTGDLTLAGAVSGARAFSAEMANGDETLWCLAPNGSTDREYHRGAWSTGGILTRSASTLDESTTGGLINLGAGPHDVFVVPSRRDFTHGFLRSKASSADAALTAEVGTMHILDISTFTANRNLTLPAPTKAGERIGALLSTGNTTYSLIVIGAAGVKINNGTAATEWSRLFSAHETVTFRSTSTTNWEVELDARIPQSCRIDASGPLTEQNLTDETWTKAEFDVVVFDTNGLANLTTNQIKFRRNGLYILHGVSLIDSTVTIGSLRIRLYDQIGLNILAQGGKLYSANDQIPGEAIGFSNINLATVTACEMWARKKTGESVEGLQSSNGTYLEILEVV